MKALKTLLPAAVLAAGLAVAASANATVQIGYSVNGGSITTAATGANNASISGLTIGVFNVNDLSAVAFNNPLFLTSSAIDTDTTGAGFIDIFVTETGLANATDSGGSFRSGVTTNFLVGGVTLTSSTFASASNQLWTGTLLASHLFTGAGPESGSSVNGFVANGGTGFYSITEQYHLVSTGAGGGASSTISMLAVPEPATWGLMIMGFGGIGALVRGRRARPMAATA
jgi:hypothetical protein